MPITILSPYSGRPVKVRDQDVGRAIRDAEGRIFYIVDGTDGRGAYASMTRHGSEKDEQRYRKLEDGSATVAQHVRETAQAPAHDATGRKRRNPVGLLVLLLLLAALAAAVYVYVARPDLVPWLDKPQPEQQEPPAPAPGEPATGASDPSPDDAGLSVQPAEPVGFSVWVVQRGLPTHGMLAVFTGRGEGGTGATVATTPALDEPEEPTDEATWRPGVSVVPVAVPDADPLAGFRVTSSGLRYKVIERGEGQPAAAGHFVEVRYAAYRLDGEVLIADARHAFLLATGQAIRALDEGLAGVRPGGQRQLYVPRGHSTAGHLPGIDELPDGGYLLDVLVTGVRPGVMVSTELKGNGPPAGPGDRLTLAYAGWVEGREELFDSNETRGGPMRLTLGRGTLMMGLEAGLAGIRAGEIRLITIPPYLAYGEQGVAGGLIPPNAVLNYRVNAFSVETDVESADEAGPEQPAP